MVSLSNHHPELVEGQCFTYAGLPAEQHKYNLRSLAWGRVAAGGSITNLCVLCVFSVISGFHKNRALSVEILTGP